MKIIQYSLAAALMAASTLCFADNAGSAPVTISIMNYSTYPVKIGLRNFSQDRGHAGLTGLANVAINGNVVAGSNTTTVDAATSGAPGQVQISATFLGTDGLGKYSKISQYELAHNCNPFMVYCLVPGSYFAHTSIETNSPRHPGDYLTSAAARLDILFNSGGNYSTFDISGIAWRQNNHKDFHYAHHNYVDFFNGFLLHSNSFYSYDHKKQLTVCVTASFQNGQTMTTSTLLALNGGEPMAVQTYPVSYTFTIYPSDEAECQTYYPYKDGINTNTHNTPNKNWINN